MNAYTEPLNHCWMPTVRPLIYPDAEDDLYSEALVRLGGYLARNRARSDIGVAKREVDDLHGLVRFQEYQCSGKKWSYVGHWDIRSTTLREYRSMKWKLWPFTEQRNQNFTDLLTSAFVKSADVSTVAALGLASLETACNLLQPSVCRGEGRRVRHGEGSRHTYCPESSWPTSCPTWGSRLL